MKLKGNDVRVERCSNQEADEVYRQNYWLKRTRRSRRLSYAGYYLDKKVAWIQCADPFGTKLARPLQIFGINEAVELCRGYFIDDTPSNMESCIISAVMRSLANDWYNEFGVIKKVAIVYQDLDVNQKGVVYKATGFKPYIKCTRARHYSVPARGNSRGRKVLWARALRKVNGSHYRLRMPDGQMTMEELEDIIGKSSCGCNDH